MNLTGSNLLLKEAKVDNNNSMLVNESEDENISQIMRMDDDNFTDLQYLSYVLGPQHIGLEIVIPMSLVYSLIFLSGVVGNILVCLVILKNRSMHTATNYYLFSLAVTDLLLLVLGLPYELAMQWQQYPWIFGETLCKIRALISEMMSYASVLTIVAFSMERYLAICHPINQFAMSGFGRAMKIITMIWIISFFAAFPYYLFTSINYIDRPLNSGNYIMDSAMCTLLDSNISPKGLPLYQLSSILFFLLPLIVLVYLYIRMGLSLNKSNENVTNGARNSQVHGESLNKSRDIVLRMLGAVVVAFFVCWAPFHAQRLGYVYFKTSHIYISLHDYFFYISGSFYFLSATVNPILYNVMSHKYRNAFRATLCRRGQTPSPPSRTYIFRSSVRNPDRIGQEQIQMCMRNSFPNVHENNGNPSTVLLHNVGRTREMTNSFPVRTSSCRTHLEEIQKRNMDRINKMKDTTTVQFSTNQM